MIVSTQQQAPRTGGRKTARRPRRQRKPGRGRRTESDVAAGRHEVLVLGAGRLAARLRELVRRLGLDCRAETEPREVLENMKPRTGLVLVAPPLPDLSVADFCRELRRRPHGGRLPVFVIGLPARLIRSLYEAGASAQFDWPKERAALIRAILRTVGTGNRHRPPRARDVALAAKLKERLDARRDIFGPLLNIEVQRGVVVLSGEVDALWKVTELERTVGSVSGVHDVNTAHVRVVPPRNIPDSVVSRSLGSMLRHASGLDDQTFAFDVSGGVVVLSGTASSKAELTRVIRLAEQIAGVRSIENLISIAPRAKQPERRLADAITRLIDHQFPRAQVRARVFGKVVALSGTARDAAERRSIEQLAAEHPQIEGVISKIG
jgi:osmotically-inducible protein OsmY